MTGKSNVGAIQVSRVMQRKPEATPVVFARLTCRRADCNGFDVDRVFQEFAATSLFREEQFNPQSSTRNRHIQAIARFEFNGGAIAPFITRTGDSSPSWSRTASGRLAIPRTFANYWRYLDYDRNQPRIPRLRVYP